ncbi:MAG: rhamnogalacturonan acetylesterase, partial [Bacteroidaceae bacterium]|nr:rhamnogalacturonan acetylesterase [Bacteroidaceae bacterium]
VPVIDLTAMTTTLFETMGVEGSKKALVHYPAGVYGDRKLEDNTHFNTFGAYEVSKMVVMGLKQLNIPFVKELRIDWKDFNPAQPDAVDQWKWYDSTMVDTKKPDGN